MLESFVYVQAHRRDDQGRKLEANSEMKDFAIDADSAEVSTNAEEIEDVTFVEVGDALSERLRTIPDTKIERGESIGDVGGEKLITYEPESEGDVVEGIEVVILTE